ncbi:LysR family transcriptional regulator [Paenibacillus aceris]|uniref:DNA-binding transcriptional LysR family regulator n=1 Tax=Paenibacillus aceris TaxID=869555 RepID=A0ABS4I9B9_9BACL|nr:LysR family transcriptional regulator [Paenibacillus aceris]MBP1967280.1 DNA-binding transcriptional LysR family regulator [Paenibacillus aceris]NHW33570.1 LysR family transcriptional regulator [Paenibacillus aceris]
MDIRQLRYFIAIVEERTVSAAAKRLHLSQPPLSQQLKAMEEELGTFLVERTGKYLKVTEAGKKLYDYALQMVQLMEEAKLEVKEVGIGKNGTLTIGVNTFSVAELPEVLHQFQTQYPKVTYKIQQSESAHLCQLVRSRAVELAFIRMPLELGDDLCFLHLYTEPFYLITSNKQKQFAHDVSLADIQDLPLMLPSIQGLGVHYLILEAFSQLHLPPNIMGECSDISLLMSLISSDFCASIVPETLLKRHKGYEVNIHKISETAKMSSPVGLIWLKNHRLSNTAQNFIDLIKKEGMQSHDG